MAKRVQVKRASAGSGVNANIASNDALLQACGIKSISVVVPPGATLVQLEDSLTAVIKGYRATVELGDQLKPVIGRLLKECQTRLLWKATHSKFTAYLEDVVDKRMGLSVRSAWDAIKVAKAFPTMSVEDYRRFGAMRLLEASKITSESEPNFMAKLEEFAVMPLSEVKERVKAARPIDPNKPAALPMIVVREPAEVVSAWQAFYTEYFAGDNHAAFAAILKEAMDARKHAHKGRKAA